MELRICMPDRQNRYKPPTPPLPSPPQLFNLMGQGVKGGLKESEHLQEAAIGPIPSTPVCVCVCVCARGFVLDVCCLCCKLLAWLSPVSISAISPWDAYMSEPVGAMSANWAI